jgi:hypothetical protein
MQPITDILKVIPHWTFYQSDDEINLIYCIKLQQL